MCQKCVKRAKNFGQSLIRPGLARVLAHQLRQGLTVPLFADRASNFAIEAHAHRIGRAKTKRHYRRKGRRAAAY